MKRALSRAARFDGLGTTVFSEFSALAQQHGAINLGQGFPDFDGPDEVREAARQAILDGVNQYAVGTGAPVLRQAIARHVESHFGLNVDPERMISVTSGATEAIFDVMLATVNPGEEVVLFEPYYDSYAANVQMVGGVPRFVPLRPPDDSHAVWWFERDELVAAFSNRTALVVVNTPHNPTGKVFTRDELRFIGELCERHDALILADEVYEHIVFPPAQHVSLRSLPELEPRCLSVSSAGKTFSVTGWKLGWVIAPPALRDAVQAAHQFVTFASAAPLQNAIAQALAMPRRYFDELRAGYQARRDLLVRGLRDAGLRPLVPEGSYFVMADITPWGFDDDDRFCRWLTEHVGVTAIPPSVFYGAEHRAQGKRLARFAFCKRRETLAHAVERLISRGPR